MGATNKWGGAKNIAVGGSGRLMVIDSAGNAYSKESTYDAWIKQVDGATWIGIGSTGRMAIIDGSFNLYYKDAPTLIWNQIYRSGFTQTNAYYVSIN
jgi:hypothetical protein